MVLARLIKMEMGFQFLTALNSDSVLEVEPTSGITPGAQTMITMRDGKAMMVQQSFEQVVGLLSCAPPQQGERFVRYTTVSGKRSIVWVGAIEGIVDHGDYRAIVWRNGQPNTCTSTPYDELDAQIYT